MEEKKMNALHAFLVFLSWLNATHYGDVFAPDSAGNGQHIVFEGNVVDALSYAIHTGGQFVATVKG